MSAEHESGTGGQALALRGVSQSQLLASHQEVDREALLQLITTRSTDDYLFADRLLKNFTISDIPFEEPGMLPRENSMERTGEWRSARDETEAGRMNNSIVNQGFYFDDDDILSHELDAAQPTGLSESVMEECNVTDSCLAQRSLFSSTEEDDRVCEQPDETLVGPDERESALRAEQLDKAAVQYRLLSSVMAASCITQSVHANARQIENPLFDSSASGGLQRQTTWRALADGFKGSRSACERQWCAWRQFHGNSLMTGSVGHGCNNNCKESEKSSEKRLLTWKQVRASRKTTTWRELKAAFQHGEPKYRYSMTLLELYQRSVERQKEHVGATCGTQTSQSGALGWFERLFSQLDASKAAMTQSTPADEACSYNRSRSAQSSDCSVLSPSVHDSAARECAVQTTITIPHMRSSDAERIRRALTARGRTTSARCQLSSALVHRLPDLRFLRRASASPNELAAAGKSPTSLTSSSGFSSTSCCSNASVDQRVCASRARSTANAQEPCEELTQSAHAEEDVRCRLTRQSSSKPRKSVSFNEIIEFHSPSPNPSSSPEQSPSRCGSSQLANARASQHGRMRLAMSIPDLVQLQVECPPLEFAAHAASGFARAHSPSTLTALKSSTRAAQASLANEPVLRSKLRVFVNDLLSGVDLIAKHFTLVEMVGFSCSHVCSGRASETDSGVNSAASKVDIAALQRKLDRVFLEYFVGAVHQLLGDRASSCQDDKTDCSPAEYWTFLQETFAPSATVSHTLAQVDSTFRARLETAFRQPMMQMQVVPAVRTARQSFCSASGSALPDSAYWPTLKLILLLARVLNDGLLFDFFDVLFAAATSHVVERHYRASSALHLLHQLLLLEFELAGESTLADSRSDACRVELRSLHDTSVRQLRELFSHLERLRRMEFCLDADSLMRQFVDEQDRLAASGGCCSIATSPSNNTLSTHYATVNANTVANSNGNHYAVPYAVVRSSSHRPHTTAAPFDPAVGLSLALSGSAARKTSFIPVRVTPLPSQPGTPSPNTAQAHVTQKHRVSPVTNNSPRGAHTPRTAPVRRAAARLDNRSVGSSQLQSHRNVANVNNNVAKNNSPRSSNANSTVLQNNAVKQTATPSFVQRLYQKMRFTNKK